MPDTLLRTLPFYLNNNSKIDKGNGKISDIAVITMGEAKGHGIWIDDKFLSQLTDVGNQLKQGVKARFGHPSMSSTALGTFLGRFTNFRKKDNKVFADLQLSETAKDTPSGNLYKYVLNLASEEADMFGTSIVFKRDVALEEIDNKDSGKKYFARLSQLHGVDMVDNPAANPDGLFSEFSETTFAGKVSNFLDMNPQIFELLNKKPEVLNGFLERYNKYKEIKMGKENKEDVGLEAKILDLETSLKTGNDKINELSKLNDDLKAEVESFKDKNATLKKIKTEFGDEIVIASLEQDLNFEQAKDVFIANLKLKNETLKKAVEDSGQGTNAVPFSENNEQKELSKEEQAFNNTKEKMKDVVGDKLSAYATTLKLALNTKQGDK